MSDNQNSSDSPESSSPKTAAETQSDREIILKTHALLHWLTHHHRMFVVLGVALGFTLGATKDYRPFWLLGIVICIHLCSYLVYSWFQKNIWKDDFPSLEQEIQTQSRILRVKATATAILGTALILLCAHLECPYVMALCLFLGSQYRLAAHCKIRLKAFNDLRKLSGDSYTKDAWLAEWYTLALFEMFWRTLFPEDIVSHAKAKVLSDQRNPAITETAATIFRRPKQFEVVFEKWLTCRHLMLKVLFFGYCGLLPLALLLEHVKQLGLVNVLSVILIAFICNVQHVVSDLATTMAQNYDASES